MKSKDCGKVESTSNMSRDIGYLQVVCQSSKLRKIGTHGPVPLLHQRLRGFESLRVIVLPTAPHKRGYHHHIQDKQSLPPLQMTPLPSAPPSSRAFPQKPSPQQSRSTHIRYWTRQHPFTVPLGSSTPLLPTPAPNRKQCRPHFFACAAYNNMLTKSGTHRWLVQLFFLPRI